MRISQPASQPFLPTHVYLVNPAAAALAMSRLALVVLLPLALDSCGAPAGQERTARCTEKGCRTDAHSWSQAVGWATRRQGVQSRLWAALSCS